MGVNRELRVVALQGESLEGAQLIATASVKDQGGRVATVFQVHVVPEWRGKGVGTAVVRAIERELGAAGYRQVSALVEVGGPLGFWGGLGYEVVHQEDAVKVMGKRLEERCACQSVSNFASEGAMNEEVKVCQ